MILTDPDSRWTWWWTNYIWTKWEKDTDHKDLPCSTTCSYNNWNSTEWKSCCRWHFYVAR